jgi:hypothetical protein
MTPQTPITYRDLQGDADAHGCCRKSLIGSTLAGKRTLPVLTLVKDRSAVSQRSFIDRSGGTMF